MSLVEHAERELKLAGLFDDNSDYGGMLGDAVLKMVKIFAEEGHSGCSAHLAIDIFNKLARFKTLTPLTDNPDEWMDIADAYGGTPGTWQSRRQGSCFSNDGGRTYYDIDAVNPRDVVESTIAHIPSTKAS